MELRPRLLFTAVLSIAVLAPAASAGAATQAVSMNDNVFSPANVQVDPGDTVTWTNRMSMDHTVTADAGAGDSGPLGNGAAFSHTFPAAGAECGEAPASRACSNRLRAVRSRG